MKNLVLLLFVALFATVSFGQVKVLAPNGDVIINDEIGNQIPGAELEVVGRVLSNTQSVVNTGASASTVFDRTDLSAFIIGAGGAAGMSWDRDFDFELRSNERSRIVNNRFITNGVSRFKILGSNGSTGIGVAAPAQRLHVAGNIALTGTVMNTSDRKSKKNVENFNYGLDAVLAMSPYSYEYNGANGVSDNGTHVGVIAQELQKIVPELVVSYDHVTENENAEVIKTEEFLAVKESSIKYILVNAIQEQQELIEAQAEQIAQLQEAINTIGATDRTNRTGVTLSSYDLAELGQNVPNPFNGFTNIDYVVPTNANSAKISIFGTNGQLLKTLDIEHTGEGTLEVNAQDLPSGTYSYQLIVDGRSIETNKMVLAK